MKHTIMQWAVLGLVLTGTACMDATSPEFDPAFGGASMGNLFEQKDRFGLPAIATVFIAAADRDAYNGAIPANDRRDWLDDVVAVLQAFGQAPDAADALARALLPDVQPFNTTQSSGFLNGRRLQDDVITAELGLIFGANAALNDDHVDANDKPFLGQFPYLAAPSVP